MNNTFFIKAGWLVDGSGKPASHDVLVRVESGKVTDMGPFRSRLADDLRQRGADVPFLDFSSFTVIPGLIDAHVHLCWSGSSNPEIRRNQLEPDDSLAEATIKTHIREHLANGVAAVRDGGDRLGHAGRFASLGRGTIEIKAAGRAWHKMGRYGSIIGRPVPPGLTLARAILEDIETCDHVKVVQSGLNSLTVFGKPCKAQFSLEELTDAVNAAKSRGLSVMAHANGPEAVEIAINAGCASIEHGFFMGRDNLLRLADSRCIWVPTSVTMSGYSESMPYQSTEAATARMMLSHQLEQISLAKRLGVKVAVGTDSGSQGVFHGRAVKMEMENLVSAGFSAEDAIGAATGAAGELLGLGGGGLIKKDRDATFVAIPGPPGNFINNLGKPAAFYVKGRKVFG